MPLFAANAGDWISFIIPIVVAIVWVLNQVIGRLAQPQNPQVRRPQPPQPQHPQSKVEEEIEAFLRRSQQRGQKPRPSPTPQQSPARPPLARRESHPLRRTPEVVPVEVVEVHEGPADPPGMSVSEHVRHHLDTREFSQRASSITKVDQADEQLQQRLSQAFDHEVGTLGGSANAGAIAAAASAAATANKVTAGGVFAMLKDPNSLRNAIILQEILRRPDER